MTEFDKTKFNYSGGYLTYGTDHKFVARFKYTPGDHAHFKSFLIKNFSVEEYFAARDADVSPLKILETKGYVSKTVQHTLKRSGFAQTLEGLKAYIAEQMRKSDEQRKNKTLAVC